MKFFLANSVALIFILLLGINNVQASSECYDHWNGDAWHGTGAWAMVMCLDSPKFISCQVRSHDDGSVIKDLHPHIAQDQGRDIWTVYDYGISYPWVGKVLDLVCTDPDLLTYTFTFTNTRSYVWGACGPYPNEIAYGGPACENDQNEKILTIASEGNGAGTVTRSSHGVKCTSDGNGRSCYHSPSSLTITAVPDVGNVFTGWSGDGCTGTASTCVLDMSQDKNVTATFMKIANAPVNYMLLK